MYLYMYCFECHCLSVSIYIYYCMGRTVSNVARTCGLTHLLVFSGNKICLNETRGRFDDLGLTFFQKRSGMHCSFLTLRLGSTHVK